jgi:hypothetical protein
MKNIDKNKLLSRADFKRLSFELHNYTCVFCKDKAIDAHHIFDRKLFKDGGYYLNNVAPVCEKHHMDCEKTIIELDDVWLACNITEPVYPVGFDKSLNYDKWGNIIVNEYSRIPGPLFNDDGVQKIFKEQGNIWIFSNH